MKCALGKVAIATPVVLGSRPLDHLREVPDLVCITGGLSFGPCPGKWSLPVSQH